MEKTDPMKKCSLIVSVLFGIGIASCAHYVNVTVPPRIDLQTYPLIGLMEFSSNSDGELNQSATHQFMTAIQKSQPQVRFLELGSQKDLLKTVNRTKWDADAIKAIGKKFNVTTVFIGDFQIAEVKPKIKLSTDLSSVSAAATLKITMTSKHMDAGNGATLWSNSRYGEWKVAGLNKGPGNIGSISLDGIDDKYDKYIRDLAFAVTDDYRIHYRREKVEKK